MITRTWSQRRPLHRSHLQRRLYEPHRVGKQPVRVSKEQAAAIRMVEASFPQALVALLPKYRPPVLRDAIVDALGNRTAAQLVERVSRRWIEHGYAEALFGGKGITSPVGVAVALLRAPADCPHQSCEDGLIVGSGVPCVACQMRRADRRAPNAVAHVEPSAGAAASLPGQSAPPPAKWWCVTGCGFSSYAVAPQDQLCRDCRSDAQAEAALADPAELALVRQAVEAALVGGEVEGWDALLYRAGRTRYLLVEPGRGA